MIKEIIYPELSYKIVGVLFKVHRELGNRYQEKYYQRAVAVGFKTAGLNFTRELEVPILFDGRKVGKYYLDFLVEDKVVVELKTIDFFKEQDYYQVVGYLASKNIRLGILANFRGASLTHKRIINTKYKDSTKLNK